jgi:hypothetical protein
MDLLRIQESLQKDQSDPKNQKDPEPTDDEWEAILDPTLVKIKNKEAAEIRDSQSKEQWLNLRWLAKHDLYFLAYSILGYTRLAENLHGNYCKWIEANRVNRFLMELLPRNHFKSTTDTISDSIQIALPGGEDMPYPYNLGTNAAILIAHEAHTSAKRYLFEITAHFLTNTALIALFPEAIPTKKLNRINKEELELPRTKIQKEPTFDTMGVGGSSQGRHFDALKLDDLVGKKQMDSATEMQNVLDWFDNIQSFFRIFKLGIFRLTGTRWGDNDVYAHAQARYGDLLKVYRRPAEEWDEKLQKKVPIFPEEVSSEDLEILKKNKKIYRAQYENDPDSGESEFDGSGINKRFGWGPSNQIINFVTKERIDIRDTNVYILVDPAPEGLGGYLVTATDHKARHYVLEAKQEELGATQVCEWVFSRVIKWMPVGVAIEEVLFSELYRHWFESEMRLRNVRFNVIPYKTKNQTKIVRVKGLSSYFSAGNVYFNETHYSRSDPSMGGDPTGNDSDLVYQLKKFPTIKHYHTLDALAQGPSVWTAPRDKTKWKAEEEKYKKELQKRDATTGYSEM